MAQNLVPNGDFEQYTICPNDFSHLERATYWINPTNGTPDYNNECSTSGALEADVPYNWAGY